MCGIWGLISLNNTDIIKSYELFTKIKHRGPDKSTFITTQNYIIGFHRLAIMDTSIQGDQPFSHSYYPDKDHLRTIYIICNGEIYNHKVLRNNITNFTFKSNSDCETLLPLYIDYGINMVKQLNGEYAIAIYDMITNINTNNTTYSLYLTRDRFGIRPLFYTYDNNTITFSSEVKGLNNQSMINIFEPRTWMCFNMTNNNISSYQEQYYQLGETVHYDSDLEIIYKNIRDKFISSVTSRLQADRKVGCLLSGGLDSSLVAACASKILQEQDKQLYTFSIGMEDSPDVKYANLVAKHINSVHTNITLPSEEWLKALDNIVYITETYDITTNRASVPQYLLLREIARTTDIKVVLGGDGSDELLNGYIYNHNAPNENELHNEALRRLEDIHYFDVLRPDRCIAYHGIESRVPFLDYEFVDYYLNIDPLLRMPKILNNNKCEKYLLRKAFDDTDYLPKCVLWRKKEAFSDGITAHDKSWFKTVQEHFNKVVQDDEYINNINNYTHLQPYTKESYVYRKLFNEHFTNQDHLCEYFWMPKWVESTDPSARTLTLYTT